MADHIQINDVAPRVQYIAGGDASFTYPFAIFKAADLEVYLGDVKQIAGYAVTGAGATAGGACVFDVAPAAGIVVTLRRRLALERTSDHQADGILRAKVLNDELDYQVAALQQLSEDMARAVTRRPTSTSSADLTLPEPVAGRAIKWASDGAALVNSDNDPDAVVAAATAAATTATDAAATATDKAGIATTAAGTAVAAAEAAQAAAASVGDPLQKAQNLADLPDKAAARTALSVYSQAEIDSAIAAAGATDALLDRLAFLEVNLAVTVLRDQIDTGWSVLKMVNGVADEFEDQTGIGALGGATYDATGDYIHNPGGVASYGPDLTSPATIAVDSTGGGAAANLVDDNASTYWYSTLNGGTAPGVAFVQATFSVARHIRRVSIQHYDLGGGANTVPLSISIQRKVGGTWTTVQTVTMVQNFTKQTFDLPASDAQTEWRLLYATGAGGANWCVAEIEMMEAVLADPADITTVSAASAAVAGSTDNEARLVILHQPVDAVTLNTDIIAEISRDDGVTWSAATLVNDGAFDATTNILTGVADTSAQPAGTAMRWRVRTLNGKEQRLHGVWMQWR